MNTATKNKIFNAILAEALEDCLDDELKKYDEIKFDRTHEFSPQYKMKRRKIINSVGRKNRIKKYKHIAVRSVISIAAAFGLVFGVLLTQPEVYAAVQNVIRNVFDKYDKYECVSEELTVENFDDSFRLGYVPEGYYLSEGNYSPAFVTLTYTNENEKIIFAYGIADSLLINHDNEHNIFETFTVDKIEYYYYRSIDKDFYSTLLWYENGYAFVLDAQLSKDELVKIAENVEK